MLKRLFKLTLQVTFLLSTLVGIFVFLVWAGLFGQIPEASDLEKIQNNLATEIYSADNVLIGRYYLQERSKVKFESIPEHVKHALIATEDARFYDHKGVDYRSMMRVLVKTVLLQNRRSGGGSTLSQQLSRNVFPRAEHGKLSIPVNKIKEAITAYRLENIYDKKEILTLYLNTVPFGDNVFGIGMASERFYNKKVDQLSTDEAAVLIGMLKSNYYYNPRLFPEKSKMRRNVVLSQMHKYGYLSNSELNDLKNVPLKINYRKKKSHDGIATHFREQVRKEVLKWCNTNKKEDGTHYNLYTDGLRIYTTIDSKLQRYAESAMKEHMAQLQKSFDSHWSSSKPWTKKPTVLEVAIKNSPRYIQLKANGLSESEAIKEMEKKHLMNVFSWSGDIEKEMSSIDSIKHYLSILQTGILAMDPGSGDIKAWVGGIDHKYFQYDHVNYNTKRQVGSTFKPLVYATALEAGFDPCQYISGARVSYTNQKDWTPDNADAEENILKYSYEGALAQSVNTVTIKVLEDAGIANTILLARNSGIKSELPEVPSLALGTASISLMEMVTTYCSFANGGMSVTPRMISKIEDNENNLIEEFKTAQNNKRVMSAETAQIMNHLMMAVVDHGTAKRLKWKYGLKNQVAGKTGTTQSNADGWFIGYNPELVVGVWTGADNPAIRFRSTSLGSGANMALPVFGKIFQKMGSDPKYRSVMQSKFPNLSAQQQQILSCELSKEDKNFFEKVLNIKKNKDKVKSKEFGEKKEKKGFFHKVGSLFKKKKKD